MFFRRSIAVLLVVLLTAGYSSAFHIFIHAEITENAILAMQLTWVPKAASLKADLKGRWFTEDAINEIVNADVSRDTLDCGKDPMPAVPCGVVDVLTLSANSSESTAAKYSEVLMGLSAGVQDLPFAGDHFDDENFFASNKRILDGRAEVLTFLKNRDYVMARKRLGQILHTLQDFYAHTNWVDLGNPSTEPRLANPKLGENAFSTGVPRVAAGTEPTCWYVGSTLLTDVTPSQKADVEAARTKAHQLPPGAMQAVLQPLQPFLYAIDNWPKDKPLTSGYFPDSNPRIAQYNKCEHGLGFLQGLIPNLAGEYRGINKDYPYGDDKNTPLAVRHTRAKQLARAHTTAFLGDLLDDGCGSDIKCVLGLMGRLGEKCPDPVSSLYKPNADYSDVNSKKWNDTGLSVAPGDKIDVRVLIPGLIIWRRGLLGGDDVAPPQGDPRVTPRNTLGWVDPQLPINVAPIGALIGMVLDLSKQTDPPIEKPDGATYFPILTGGRFTMTASGNLFLGINDGVFYNNLGCFQAAAVKVN
jgi:hypothetical protein